MKATKIGRTEPHDEKGCVGCFWYDPYKWREELNKIANEFIKYLKIIHNKFAFIFDID